MIQSVLDMEKILRREYSIYEELYTLEEEKGEYIIERKGDMIEGISEKQEKLIGEIEALEMRREELIREYISANELQYDGMPVTLKRIVNNMDEDSSHRLLNIGMELKGIILKLDSVKKTNEILLRDSLEFYNLLIAGLKNNSSLSSGYGSDGKDNGFVSTPAIFNRTV